MEEVLLRFTHVGEEIFESLDEKSIAACRRVCRNWKNFIEDPNHKLLWIQIIRAHEKNIRIKKYVSAPRKWSKLGIQNLRKFAWLITIQNSDVKKEEMFLEKYSEANFKLEAKDKYGVKLFQWALTNRYFKLAKIHVLNFDPNAKSRFGYTALHLACFWDYPEFIEAILGQSFNLSIDVNAKANDGDTPLHLACSLNAIKCVEVLIEYGEPFKLDLTAKDENGKTALQLAEHHLYFTIANLIKRKLPIGRY